MTKKKSPPADDIMTSTAKAIGSTLGKLAAAVGFEAGAASVSTTRGRTRIAPRSAAKKATRKKSSPRRKTAIVKKAAGHTARKKKSGK